MTSTRNEPGSAARLVELMRAAGLNQEGLADEIGSTQSTVSAWCRGLNLPRTRTVFAIEDALGAPGELCRVLGYARPGPGMAIEDAIASDPRLSDSARLALRTVLSAVLDKGT